jgi:pseudouridine-5'-phosphate glycosidase
MAAHWAVVPDGGLLFCQQPPAAQAIGKAELDALVARALAEAAAANVGGQALTPYLLDRLNRLSGGRTLRVNRALALANARLGAEIAVAWARRRESVPVLD